MFNATLYLPRYMPALQVACEIYPRTHRIAHGKWSPATNVARVRETRNYLVENADKFTSLFDGTARTNLSKLKVWADEQHLFIGNPNNTELNPLTSANENALAADLSHTLTLKDIQAIFYVLERGLVTLPIRIHNPDKATVTEIQNLSARCQNVEMTHTHNTITLF